MKLLSQGADEYQQTEHQGSLMPELSHVENHFNEIIEIIDKMPNYLWELERCPAIKKGSDNTFHPKLLTDIGVYVFYEDEKPIYVGRSDGMKDRLHQHGRPGSDHYSASFAFNIAKQECLKDTLTELNVSPSEESHERYLELCNRSRKKWAEDPEFEIRFKRARERVRNMSIRVVEIEDPIEQAIFEIYAHMKLGTPKEFNTFKNH